MPDNSVNNKRIAKNTILLYFRMLFIMAVQLYTSRVVLNTLGVDDYGIYNVVGGVVAMFGFLNSAMTTSTQRYITYELGLGNFARLKQVFTTSVNIHLLISVVVVILAETVGLWFLNEKMFIPEERATAAMWVFQLSILTTVIAIMSYPYNAAIIAHEKMSAFAYISVLEAVLKLAIVYLLTIWDFDKLILYAILVAVIQLAIRFCYNGYCAKHFEETKYKWFFDKNLFKEMLGFAGWNLWGNLASMMSTQGQNMLLNVFFGPAVNAARAIAVQVQSAVHMFATNFQMALNPQITKTYASGQLSAMHRLIFRSSRFSFFLIFILSLPVILETPTILKIWLGNPPAYSAAFIRIMLCITLLDATANPLMVAASATGKVRRYQTIVGGVILLIVPLTYIALKSGANPIAAFVVHLSICIIAFVVRLFIIRPLINLRLRDFAKDVISRCALVSVISSVIPIIAYKMLPHSLVCAVIVVAFSVICSVTACYVVGLDKHERTVINDKIRNFINLKSNERA